MNSLSDKFRRIITESEWIRAGDTLLLACSGGVDSMAMVTLFLEVRDEWDLELVLGHVNHGIRDEAERDAQFVREFGRKNELPVRCEPVDVPGRVNRTGESLEMAARALRYEALETIYESDSADWICTAHTKSDQAETVLMRMLSGAGIQGFQGIRPRLGHVVRPLLGFSRGEIQEFMESRAIPYVQDTTNRDVSYRRNWIRHHLLPDIAGKINPGIEDTLAHISEIHREVAELLNNRSEEAFNHLIITEDEGKIILDITGFRGYLTAVQKAIIFKVLEELDGSGDTLKFPQMNQLYYILISGESGSRMELPGGISVVKSREQALFTSVSVTGDFHLPFTFGLTELPGYRVMVESFSDVTHEDLRDSNEWIAWFDAEVLQESDLHWRPWKHGDRMVLAGGQHKKVSDIWIDQKVPLWEKHSRPLLVDGSEVLWIPGIKRSGIGWVDTSSGNAIKMEVEPRT